MSNYRMTVNHFDDEYIRPENKVYLLERFNFNNHDLTHNSFVARTIESTTKSQEDHLDKII